MKTARGVAAGVAALQTACPDALIEVVDDDIDIERLQREEERGKRKAFAYKRFGVIEVYMWHNVDGGVITLYQRALDTTLTDELLAETRAWCDGVMREISAH